MSNVSGHYNMMTGAWAHCKCRQSYEILPKINMLWAKKNFRESQWLFLPWKLGCCNIWICWCRPLLSTFLLQPVLDLQ